MYDMIVALDWAKSNMAVARLKKDEKKPKVFERASDLEELKKYLNNLPGTKQLVFEVSGSARMLFEALHDHADDIIVCDPLENKLITRGPKTDKIDAGKLALLAQNGQLKNVFVDLSENFKLRRLVSGYMDTVKALVRSKNHISDFRTNRINSRYDEFVIEAKKKEIKHLIGIKGEYEKEFERLADENRDIKAMSEIPGIGKISAVKIVATVASPKRFDSYKNYWGYCGLAKHLIISGGRIYGKRNPRYNPMMKAIYKMAALVAITKTEEFKAFFEHLTKVEFLPEHDARNAVARHIAKISLLMLKNKSRYDAKLVKRIVAA